MTSGPKKRCGGRPSLRHEAPQTRARRPSAVTCACGALVIGGIVAAACDGGETDSSGSGAGGAGTSTSTTSWTSYTWSSTSSATTTGTGGGGGQDWGAEPVWEEMSDTVVGCTLERVSNPEEVRAFAWTPCDGQPDCSALVPADFLGTFGTETTYYVSGQARETDLGTAVALCFGQSPDYVVLIAREDGWLIDAFRILESGENDCFAGNASLGRSRFGFVVNSGTAPPPRLGGILAPLDRSEDPVACEVTPTPSMVGPQLWQWLGDERWVWEFYPSSLYSVSSYDGSGFYRIGGYTDDGPIYDMNYPSGPGDIFYFKLIYLDQNGYRGVIGQSNGVEPPTGYLEPEPGAFLSNPAYADSHIAWLRGTGQTDVTHFGAIELWASVYSPDPAELQPYKVGDVDANVMLWMQGALGHVALPANVPGQATVWRLEDGQKTAVTMPGGRRLQQLGVTAGSLWAVGFPETGIDDMIARFSF